jgi:hypothetical protein
MDVEITSNPTFRAGYPQSLGILSLAFTSTVAGSQWDSTADGKRFLVQAPRSGPQWYTVVLNWQASLKK